MTTDTPTPQTSAAAVAGRGSAAAVAGLLSLVFVGGTALAYWSTPGLGVGTAQTGTIAAPSALSVTAPGGSSSRLEVKWSAPTSGVAPAAYRVTLKEGVNAPADQVICDADDNTDAAGPYSVQDGVFSCTDFELSAGLEYAYEVTSIIGSWTAAASQSSTTNAQAVLNITDPEDDDAVNVSVTPIIKGGTDTAGTIVVTIKDAAGVVVETIDEVAATVGTEWEASVVGPLAHDTTYTATATLTKAASGETVSTAPRIFKTIAADAGPTVSSIARVGNETTNAATVSWTVAFSEAVTGVDIADFAIAAQGLTGAAKGTVSASSASTYTVTATTGTGNGTLGMNLVDDDSITDSALQPLGGATAGNGNKTGEIFTVDKTPTDTAPQLTALAARDADNDGLIDRVVATFDETLASYSASTTPWTLTNVPSGGSLASVSVSGSVATLTLTEGAGAVSTAVPANFTVALASSATGIRDAAGNQSFFAARTPSDEAAPVPLSFVDTNGSQDGQFQGNDTFTVTFSENVTPTWGTATTSAVALRHSGGSDTVTIPDLLAGTVSLGGTGYLGNGTANFASELDMPNLNQIRLTLKCAGTCPTTATQISAGDFTFVPSSSIEDAAGNAAAGSRRQAVLLF